MRAGGLAIVITFLIVISQACHVRGIFNSSSVSQTGKLTRSVFDRPAVLGMSIIHQL